MTSRSTTTLGHGRHEPALPALLDRLEHRDPKVREGARLAILGLGPEVVPDRRPTYMDLFAALEQIEP